MSNVPSRRQSLGGADSFSKLASNGFLSKRPTSSQLRSSLSSSTVLKHAKGTSKSFDGGTRSLDRAKMLLNGSGSNTSFNQPSERTKECESPNKENTDDFQPVEKEDNVPGVLYDLLQKEVIALRKAGHEKDQSLKDKDDTIKKVETLTKEMEVEAKKMRIEVAAMEKEVTAMRVKKRHENRAKRIGNSKGSVAQLLSGKCFYFIWFRFLMFLISLNSRLKLIFVLVDCNFPLQIVGLAIMVTCLFNFSCVYIFFLP